MDKRNRLRIEGVVALLADNPRPPKAIKLVGHRNRWRVRGGDYRILYEMQDDVLAILSYGWRIGVRSIAMPRAMRGARAQRIVEFSHADSPACRRPQTRDHPAPVGHGRHLRRAGGPG
ncbi:MAG: type II toxin-antitoxin system RelE/ParE family toxin [Mycobacterium sp.]|uniref:type II toxin-antitoxin system RelE family toxin n=1 Tax=Mycobacterium sp. TaxID=1785 RepID=UPI001EC67F37|nr:type II toxin-antitoxin system RelE/ParE family toxin [Mycobacterium sp.]